VGDQDQQQQISPEPSKENKKESGELSEEELKKLPGD
jgi:hypothetical protein